MGATHVALAPQAPGQSGRHGSGLGWPREDLLVLAALLVLGITVRAYVLRSSIGDLNADEVTTGLMAEEVLRGRVPLVLAGQNYSGTTEAFLYAPLHALLGPSSLALKLIPMLLWLIVAYATYRIGALLTDRRLGLLLGGVIWAASAPMVLLSTRAYAGYGSGAVAVFLALLLLLEELTVATGDGGATRRRLLLGFWTGFAIWSHPMLLATLAPAHVYLLVHKRTELLRWLPPVSLGGLAGLSPLVVWNIANHWASLRIYEQPPSTFSDRLLGFLGDVIPRLLGLRAGPGTWLLGGIGQALFLALVPLFALMLWTLWRGMPGERLVALVAVTAPLLTSVFPTSWWTADARYGMTYFPVMVLAAGLAWRRWQPIGRISVPALTIVPLLCVAITCAPALAAVAGPPPPGGPDRDVIELIRVLEAADVRHLRADYWTAQPVTFLSDHRIVASGFDVVRFPELEWQVQQAGDTAAFTAITGDLRDDELRATLPAHTRREVARYALYLP